MTSDGTPWRPLVHINDICQAIMLAVKAPRDAVHNETFNVGDNEQNYRIRDIAATVGRVFDGCAITFGRPSGDNRSYRTSFDKIHHHLPEFRCQWSAESGARQLHQIFSYIKMTKDMFAFRGFTRLEQLKHLIATGQLDHNFFWKPLQDGTGGGP